MPLFGQPGVMARTDYIVDGPSDCMLFLTASKADRKEGRPFCADDRRRPDLVLCVVHRPRALRICDHALDGPALADRPGDDDPSAGCARSWIDAYASHDDGRSWSFLATPEPETGEGNPPSLLRLPDGRLCLIYGVRVKPYGIRTG